MHDATSAPRVASRQRRPLRVLHLPTNTASLPSHTVRAQRELGIDARAVEYSYAEPSWATELQGVEHVRLPVSYRSPAGLRCIVDFARRTRWADVIHWYYSTRLLPRELDFRIIRTLRKPAFVEWMGSDIRDPEVEAQDNPVFREFIERGNAAGVWSAERSREAQHAFCEAGFVPLAAPGMVQYVLPEYRVKLRVVDRAVVLGDYEPPAKKPSGERIVIAHAPSRLDLKGTDAVVAAVETLRSAHEFEFDLIHGVPRSEAIRRIGRADIFVDQLILGDYGMAAIEAMALGVPVVCYVKPQLVKAYGNPPIENATPATVGSALMRLLGDPSRRQALAARGLQYVRERHDAMNRARRLLTFYLESMGSSRRGARQEGVQ